ncbi:hypothetical protein RHSIM_Rhsim03G0001900 [Rhododendron simsii]|uniref:Small ribosomal subunit protein uS7 domain-containing protein n=2 Tax=Magnoliopsida TaxID=3398 RepID=A0A834HC11_RHOSS|nr:hypothetical protein RHSIM_Rhsim03G0001900 [Rhododendron simsii]
MIGVGVGVGVGSRVSFRKRNWDRANVVGPAHGIRKPSPQALHRLKGPLLINSQDAARARTSFCSVVWTLDSSFFPEPLIGIQGEAAAAAAAPMAEVLDPQNVAVNYQNEKASSQPLTYVKLYNRWCFDGPEGVSFTEVSLLDYIAVNPTKHATYVPHTAGRYSNKRFRKAQCPIVERLTNSLMMHGRNNGKKLMAVRIVKHAMEIIHLLTDQNPIQVIVDAVINSGPREDATRIGSAGVVRRQAVDISPLRRVNQAIYLLTTGARESAFRNIKTVAECLADELINAAKGSSNSYAIKKKDEIERVAKANR